MKKEQDMHHRYIKKLARFIPVAMIISAVVAQPVIAEDVIEFEEISVTAARVETKISETASSISIIDRDEIDKVKFTDASELMDRVPGVSMTRNLRIPIGGKNYTVNLVDGMAIQAAGSGTIGFAEQTNTFDIEKIEIVRGPASALYGSNALGGVINVITREAPKVPEYRVWGELGEYERSRAGVSAAGTTKGGLGYFADVNYLYFDGFRDRTKHDRKAGSLKLIHKPNDTSSLTFRAEYFEMFREDSGQLTDAQYKEDWSQARYDDRYSDKDSLTTSLKYAKEIGDDSGFEINYARRFTDSEGHPSYSNFAKPSQSEQDSHDIVAMYNRKLGYMDSRIIAGVEVQRTTTETSKYGDTTWADEQSKLEIEDTTMSPFMQYEISPFDKTRITLGGRYDDREYEVDGYADRYKYSFMAGGMVYDYTDYYSGEKMSFSEFSPKLGVTYDITPKSNIWFSYSEGFVTPGSSALITADRPNPDLTAEDAYSYEAGLRGIMLDKKLNYDFTIYDTTIEDMVMSEGPRATSVYVNAGEISIKGAELSLAYRASKLLGLELDYSYTQNKFDNYLSGEEDASGNTLKSSPDHHLNARVTVTPMELLDIELEMDYISRYYEDNTNLASSKRPTLYHLRAAYDTGIWAAWLHVKNLADKKYSSRTLSSYDPVADALETNHWAGQPRTAYAGASYTW